MARLLIQSPEGQHYVTLGPRTSIGRDPSNDVALPDKCMSRKHAIIERQGRDYLLSDAGSASGIYVNAQRFIGAHVLQEGDEIRMGVCVLRFDISGD